MSAHTPGPWTTQTIHVAAAVTCGEHDILLVVQGNSPLESDLNVGPPSICRIMFGGTQQEGEGEANAHLIAAAPDLLEALADMLRQFDDASITDDIRTQHGISATVIKTLQSARAALAKARGES